MKYAKKFGNRSVSRPARRSLDPLSDRLDLKPVQRAVLPRKLALNLLVAAVPQSSKERKLRMSALETHFAADAKRKPSSIKLTAKLRRASLTQLDRWLGRSIRRRSTCQHAYLKLTGDSPAIDSARKMLDLRAAQWDAARDAIETEIADRQGRCMDTSARAAAKRQSQAALIA